ncbi:MAG: hypothetical protein U0441_38215 [Polyangiaceae bacterium]
MRASVLLPAALLSLVPLACGPSNPQAQDPNQNQYAAQNGQYQNGQYPNNGQYPPGQYQNNGQTGQYNPNQYPTATGTSTAPAPTATTTATGSSATPVAAAAMGGDVILGGLATQEAPGAQADGSAFAGQFAEGQTLEQPINLQPGKCYTIIGMSVGGVQELDILIQGQLAPLPPTTLAQDNTTGPNATLGGKAAGCWKNPSPLPIPAKVVLRVTKGSGIAGAKVYMK